MNASELEKIIASKSEELDKLRYGLGVIRNEIARLREIPFPLSQSAYKKYWKARERLAELEPELSKGEFRLAGLMADITVLQKQRKTSDFHDLAFMIQRYIPSHYSMEFLINEEGMVIEIKENEEN